MQQPIVPIERIFRTHCSWAQRALVAIVFLAPSCAKTENPEGSSSSHWVHCKTDPDCADHDAATCGADEYCVDEQGELIVVGGSNVGTPENGDDDSASAPAELVPCDPLARWQRQVEPSDPFVVARDAAGVVYAVTPFDSDYLVWRSQGDALEPLQVVGSGSGGDELSVVVQDDADRFTLFVTSTGELTTATLFPGEQEEREPDPALGEALEILDESALAGFDVLPIDVAAAVETRASEYPGGDDGALEVLLLRPEWADDSGDFRLFYGTDGALSEVAIQDVVREGRADGTTMVEFLLPTGETTTLAYTLGAGASLSADPASEQWNPLQPRSTTDLALAPLSFQCLEPVQRRFQATGTPFEAPAMQCDTPRVPMGACVSSTTAPEEGSSVAALDVTGTLTASGTGMPPADALLSNGDLQGCRLGADSPPTIFGEFYQSNSEPAPAEELRWFHLEYDGGDSWVVLRIPALGVALPDGASVHLVQASQYDFGGPTDSSLELRDENGELLVWLGQSYTLDDLDKPVELELAAGVETCSLSSDCALDYGYYSVDARLDGNTGAAPQGESVELGDYRFTSSAFQIQTGAFVCTDSTAYFARFALWKK